MIDPNRVTAQLKPEFGDREANRIASLARGFDRQLHENALIEEMLGADFFETLAVLYGTARRVCVETIETPNQDPSVKEAASAALARMEQFVRLTDAPDPNPRPNFAGGLVPPGILDMLRAAGATVINPSAQPQDDTIDAGNAADPDYGL